MYCTRRGRPEAGISQVRAGGTAGRWVGRLRRLFAALLVVLGAAAVGAPAWAQTPDRRAGPVLDAPPGTEGWLRVKWRSLGTVQAYNVEWRPAIRNYEGHTYGRADKSALEHLLYNLEPDTVYEVRVCALTSIETYSPSFRRGTCTRYSDFRMPARGSGGSNDVKVLIEFPEGGTTKRLSSSDTVIRWRYRVTGIRNSSPSVFSSSASGVAAAYVVLQYRDETRRATVFGSSPYGAPAPVVQYHDSLVIRMDWLVFDRPGSGYVEREFRVQQSFRSTADRGPLMLYLLRDGDRALPLNTLSPHGGTRELCLEFEDSQGDVAVSCSSSQVEIAPPTVDGTPSVSGAGTDAQWSEGETVGVTVTFSEAVDVDTSGGTPSIGIGLGGTAARSATYASGTGTTELVFQYPLVSGDGSHGYMAVTPDSLALNGGTIESAGSGVAALLANNGALTSGNSARSTRPETSFQSVPNSHDGETAFTVGVQFSGAPTGLSAKRDAASIFEVTGGSVTGARVTSKGERPVWEVTVAPDGVSDVTVRMPARACGEAHAVCIGGRALGETVEAAVPGPPITAQFTQAPATHDGSSKFLLHLEFSHEPKRFSYRTVQGALFDIEGGRIEKTRRLEKGRNLRWEMTVVPDGDGAVTLTARATTDCAAANATCDADGRKFAGGLGLTVPGPETLPAVSIAPPSGTPAVEGASLAFALTRTGATDEALTVAVSVSETGGVLDGTPPVSATFEAGAASAVLSVATEDDETDEDASTVTAALSPSEGYEVDGSSGSAEAAVEDDDAAPAVGTASPIVVAENATAVATLSATDADTAAADLSWSIPEGAAGGADATQFTLTADGVLSFKAAKDFEAPDDADADGEYEITVRVTDGANPVDAALVVRLEDADDAAPALTGASVDGAALTLTFGEALDEGSVPPASSFAVTVAGATRAVDSAAVSGSVVTLTLTSAVTPGETVTVGYTAPAGAGATPVRDAAGNPAAAFADAEVTNGTAAALPTVSIAAVSTPVTEGAAAAFTLTRTGATDAALTVAVQVTEAGSVLDGTPPVSVTFAAGAAEAVLSVATVDDETVEDAGTVTAAVSAGAGYEVDEASGSAEAVVEDDDAAPVVETASPIVVAENATAVATLSATDADTAAADLSWSIPEGAAGGADAVQFALTADGVLSFKAAKDFEAPDDADADGAYEVTVRVTDGANPVDAALVVRLEDAADAAPAPAPVAAVEELWSTTLTWTDLGNNWFGGFADGFSNPGWSEDGQAFRIWYIAYDAGSRRLLMAHDGSGGLIAEPGQLALHVGGLEVGPGEALSAFAGARVGRVGGVDAQWNVGEAVRVRLTRTSGDAVQASAGPGFSVADAQANEASGAQLRFRVTLDAPAESTASVRYRTANGTAVAGADYVAAQGELRFAPGETAKTVAVAVLPDDHNEGSETMTLTLSGPDGATIADATATGTISNTGPIPQAWIARFGRTVAEQVLEAAEGRMRAAPTSGVEVSLAGERIGAGSGSGPGGQAASGEYAGARQEEEPRRLAEWLKGETDTEGARRFRAVTPHDLLTGSSFALTAETAGKDRVSLWGRGAISRFDGREGELALDGEVVTGMLGFDWTQGSGPRSWTAGLIVPHSRGEGDWSGAPAAGDGAGDGSRPWTSGRVEATLTGLFPWARHALSERLEAWGTAGYGAGDLTVTPKLPGTDEDGAAMRADLDLRMAAAGLRGMLLDGGGDGLTLTGKTDAMVVKTSSGRGRGTDGGNLETARATVTRLRLGLEASRQVALGSGAALTPSLEVGLRHDGGDAETGFGLDLGGGFTLSDPKRGLQAELHGRGLLSHQSKGFRERGFSGALGWRQRPDSDRGAKLTLTQTIGGSFSDGADALLSRATLDGLAANDNGGGDGLRSRRLELKLGYGFAAFGGRFTLTPEFGSGFSDTGRDYSHGWRLTGGPAGDGGAFEVSFEARRRENDNAPLEHEAGFRLTARF